MGPVTKLIVVVLLVLALVGSAAAVLIGLLVPADAATPAASRAVAVVPPPAHLRWDYQLGGAVPPADGVGVVTRDRTDQPVAGRYNVCYVNGFQTQASEKRFWLRSKAHWRLVLKKQGRAVADSGWGEWLLDTRTAKKRAALARIVGRWVDGCAARGFDAVELDNLDSFSRSKGLVSRSDNKAFARLLVTRAHAVGLAVGQKNWPELGSAGPRIGFDFAVAEQCGQYRECGAYVAAYGDRVLAVEYSDASFRWTCAHYGDQISVVRRDRALSAGGVRAWC